MSDKELSQKPLMVIPHKMQPTVLNFFQEVNKHNVLVEPRNISTERCESVKKLADFIETTFGAIYEKGICYLRNFASAAPKPPPPPLGFLASGRQCNVAHMHRFEKKVEESFVPYKLQVHFRRHPERVLR